MEFREYIAIWRRRWVIPLVLAVVGAGAAAGFALTQQPQYEASATLFVNTTGGASVTEAYQGNLFAKDRVTSYATVATGRDVAMRTIKQLGISMSPDALSASITAKPVPESVLLKITARNANRDLAKDLANTVAAQTAQVIAQLETSSRGGLPAAAATIVDLADRPSAAVSPNWTMLLALGTAGGLLVGLALAIVRDKTDRRVRGLADLDRTLPLTLGQVPRAAAKGSDVAYRLHEGFAIAVRQFRTTLFAYARSSSARSFAFAAVRDDAGGKVRRVASSLVANVAVALADARHTVLLVEADFDNRDLGPQFGLDADSPGLADVLVGEARAESVVQSTTVPNLSLAPAGRAGIDDPFGDSGFTDFIKQMLAEFEYVLVSSAPVLAGAEAAMIGQSVDGVVLVARFGDTRRPHIDIAATRLRAAGATVVGVLLADVRRRILAV
ncbi:polysaccharide biosynthesis tyrosine autokinase [Williamsia sp. CHRR-6]|uniref:polysaccharide biosynthesis tyrosine autokinase n=1 Tax=Williamsia sp. CHRR-6 TaxID=2835871 RepID=UPI001BDAC533|nr:polysaccharide biosynthesis tyrosine autokinase [Williamsia sp. CHRR-6]MBT0565926.1 hypothetical protein [Williamsia sp. CHRR-6]